jgi:hypothetical protein
VADIGVKSTWKFPVIEPRKSFINAAQSLEKQPAKMSRNGDSARNPCINGCYREITEETGALWTAHTTIAGSAN